MNIERHNERMNRSRFELSGAKEELRLEEAIEIPPELTCGEYKCTVIYDRKILEASFQKYKRRTIRSLKIVECDDMEYSHKYLDRSLINLLFEQRGECDDILIVRNGLMTDASFANVVFRDGNRLITPSKPLLRGTRRQKLIDEGIVIPEPVRISDLNRFREAFLVNAMLDLDEKHPVKVIH